MPGKGISSRPAPMRRVVIVGVSGLHGWRVWVGRKGRDLGYGSLHMAYRSIKAHFLIQPLHRIAQNQPEKPLRDECGHYAAAGAAAALAFCRASSMAVRALDSTKGISLAALWAAK